MSAKPPASYRERKDQEQEREWLARGYILHGLDAIAERDGTVSDSAAAKELLHRMDDALDRLVAEKGGDVDSAMRGLLPEISCGASPQALWATIRKMLQEDGSRRLTTKRRAQWQPLRRAQVDRDEIEIWENDRYQVQVTMVRADIGFVRLSIRRRDGGPILRDWRDFQNIKNELLGAECEAAELYPAESRKVDRSNKFHLWGWRTPLMRFPFGFTEREVWFDGDKTGMTFR